MIVSRSWVSHFVYRYKVCQRFDGRRGVKIMTGMTMINEVLG